MALISFAGYNASACLELAFQFVANSTAEICSMNEIIRMKHYGRTFLIAMGLGILFSLSVRYFVIPKFDPSLALGITGIIAKLIESLTFSLTCTVLIALTVYYWTPQILRGKEIEVIGPKEIRPMLMEATGKTKRWIYKGSCGRYTRASTLPRLADSAKRKRMRHDIEISVLDPSDDALCEAYASYRRGFEKNEYGSGWTVTRVREEVLATILSVLKDDYRSLDTKVYLVRQFSTFRLDITDEFVVVTREDPKAGALRAERGSFYYESFIEDARVYQKQGKSLPMIGISLGSDGRHIGCEEVREATQKLGLLGDDQLETTNFDSVLALLTKSADPYA